MTFHVVTLFPEAFTSYLDSSILKRAQEAGYLKVLFYNPRDYTDNKWRKADDRPYGGGPGMVMYALPVIKAAESALVSAKGETKVFIFSPSGKEFSNKNAATFSKKYTDIVLICGHYEGIDARAKKALKATELSIGPYVLTGGELPALVVIDAVARQVEGVLGDFLSLEEARTSSPDVYTRPEMFLHGGKKHRVPKVLLSGHHEKIEEWKKGRRGSGA
ncbi:MAG: tRNA (guanosine(37)-N1)-methyltransferase TrmD [Patescibacteria group bacterium]